MVNNSETGQTRALTLSASHDGGTNKTGYQLSGQRGFFTTLSFSSFVYILLRWMSIFIYLFFTIPSSIIHHQQATWRPGVPVKMYWDYIGIYVFNGTNENFV